MLRIVFPIGLLTLQKNIIFIYRYYKGKRKTRGYIDISYGIGIIWTMKDDTRFKYFKSL